MKNCPVCLSNEVQLSEDELGRRKTVNCRFCGKYFITEIALDSIKENKLVHKVSKILSERKLQNQNPLAIFQNKNEANDIHENYRIVNCEELLNMFPAYVSERLDRTLMNFVNLSNFPGHKVELKPDAHDHYIFTESTENSEYIFLLDQLFQNGYIEERSGVPNVKFKVTVKGWNRVAEIEKTLNNAVQNKAFIAMWFNDSMNKASERIEEAVRNSGYEPIRIDKKEHANKIDDEIIAEIKRSKFIIADFTGQRGGVYFEAGYALGLNKPVIWMCKENDIKNVHFDTRQYSHILWKDEEDLYKKLCNRIRAIIE